MIVPLNYYRKHGLLKGLWINLKLTVFQLFSLPIIVFFKNKRQSILKYEKSFPRLKEDEKGNNQCISCGICTQYCPTNAIDLKVGEAKIDLNLKDRVGPAPKHFEIKRDQCIQCKLCIAICPVSALTNDFAQEI
jgi:formate hydrogenlyase subunit 6/NADH:ubiquinone oxidoreductase subunit I